MYHSKNEKIVDDSVFYYGTVFCILRNSKEYLERNENASISNEGNSISNEGNSISNEGNKDLSPIKNLIQFKRYYKKLKNKICSICIDDFNQNPYITNINQINWKDCMLPIVPKLGYENTDGDITPCRCNYEYHYSCLKEWEIKCAEEKRIFTCPSCRGSLPYIKNIIMNMVEEVKVGLPNTIIQRVYRNYILRKKITKIQRTYKRYIIRMKYNKENFDTMLLNLDEALPHRIDETGDEDKNSIILRLPGLAT